MDQPVDFTINPLGPSLGAEIIGLDLSQPLPQQTIDAIREAWLTYIVLVIRDQDLTEDQQIDFAARFGEVGERKKAPDHLKSKVEGIYQTNSKILLVSNIKVDGEPVGAFGEGEFWFHIDSGYSERPYTFTFLHALELPSVGGNTLFSNLYAAYDDLPQNIKTKIAGRKALHIHEYKRSEGVDISGDISATPHWFHPVAITHPETGRKCLFVDRLMTRRIEGLDWDDSEATLTFLFDHLEQKKYIFEHVWKLGDVVMWDNRCTTHARTDFPKNENRLLRRCTVEGEPLFE